MSVLSTHKLTVSAGGRILCESLDLTVEPRQLWAVLGQNGSGKSTLLLTLAGLIHAPHGGRVHLRERPLENWSRRDLAQYRAVLLQDTETFFPTSVLDSALSGRFAHHRRWWRDSREDIAAARAALAAVGLSDFAARRLDTLSGGERRRVALAAVLAQDPTLYLLDEPGNHLDIKHHVMALELIQGMVKERNRAALVVMHDVNMALRFCDHALLLFGDGRTLAGPTDQVVNEANLADLYQYPVRRVTAAGCSVFLPA